MFKTNLESLKAHLDAAMKGASANDKESMEINLKWASEKFQTLKRLTKEEHKRAIELHRAPPYQLWTANRALMERGAGEMGLDRAFRKYDQALEEFNHIVAGFKNLKVELRQYLPDQIQDGEINYQILNLRR